MARIITRPEQIYSVVPQGRQFVLSGQTTRHVPWHQLANCAVYTRTEGDLEILLADAATRGHMIVKGSRSVRRGLRGFSVCIGAWGIGGLVECASADTWCVETKSRGALKQADEIETTLRDLCLRLNGSRIPFRTSAMRWLMIAYKEFNLEPDDHIAVLPTSVGKLCRRAHIGGPILHTRTTLMPYVHVDRTRAFGNTMMESMPSGLPSVITLKGTGMTRWRPRDLMAAQGVAEATITVFDGPLVPLVPVMRQSKHLAKTRTIYPTGTVRGAWPLCELAYLEASGRGQVERLHQAVSFEPRPVFRPLIQFIRRLEPDLKGIKVKRLEHILYGRCARNPGFTTIGSASGANEPLVADVLSTRLLTRLEPGASITDYPLREGATSPIPLYQVKGFVNGMPSAGAMDRPDRSAVITGANRVEMAKIIDQLDVVLGAERSGSYIGRIYIDGMDVEATPEQIPDIPGARIKHHGPRIDIYRSGVFVANSTKGVLFEATGTTLPSDCTPDDVVSHLKGAWEHTGPFVGGRLWDRVAGHPDSRLLPDQRSVPLHVNERVLLAMGFSSEDPHD